MDKLIKLLLIVFFSFVGLFLAFKGEDINLLALELKKVNIKGLLFSSIILLFSCLIRAIRWKILIEPFGLISTSKSFSATMIGYFGNGILVFRLGELLKAYSISRNYDIKTSHLIGTVILERGLDLFMLLLIAVLTLPWLPTAIFKTNYDHSSIILLFLIIFIIIFFLFHQRNNLKDLIFNFTRRYRKNKLIQIFMNIYSGLISIKNSTNLTKIIIYSLVLWTVYLGITFILVYSCNINLRFFDICLLFVIGSLSLGIPALPGSLGTYDAAVKYFLIVVFNLDSHEALNYVIISHAISYFPLTLVGAVFFILSNIKLKNIK